MTATVTALPAAPPRDPRGRRHSMKTVQLARRMYADGAWSIQQIRDYFDRKGLRISENTIRYWVIPGLAEAQRRDNLARYHARRAALAAATAPAEPPVPESDTPVLDRMLELREARLSFTAIAAVVGVDYGIRLTTEQARYYVQSRREPHRPKRLAEEAVA